MRIDLPLCNLKTCRKQFDGNCIDKLAYSRCEYANPWIPCSDKYPDEDGVYWCTVKFGTSRYCDTLGYAKDLSKVSLIDFGDRCGESGFYTRDSEYGCADFTKNVTAWTYIYEPYDESAEV